MNLPGYSPDFNADEAVWGWAREEAVLGQQGGGAGACRQIPGRAVQPERRGETALPDGPAIKGRNTPARLPPRFPAPGKCTSHLGFGLGYPMANQHQTFAWYRAPISYQFSLCRRSIGTLAEYVESDKEETLSAWAETAESISDPVIREGVWLHLASEGYDFDILNQLTFRALFVTSVSLFEFELLRMCDKAQRHSNNQELTIDPYKFDWRKAKGYLSSLGVRVPADLVEWNDVQSLYGIRNAVVHRGGLLLSFDDDLDFARRQGIVVQREGNPRPNSQNTPVFVKLELTRTFCGEALDTFERLLLQVSDAWVSKLILGKD